MRVLEPVRCSRSRLVPADLKHRISTGIAASQYLLPVYNQATAGSEPPDPREGFNPTSYFLFVPSHVLRAACCGPRRNCMENTMDKNLPARPNLAHLRSQAKTLLAALRSADADAIATIQKHLPAAKGMTTQQVRDANFRLADVQSAVARKNGFGSWPHLARHVEQLRALEGTWAFARLEIDGTAIPATALADSRILIDGDRFRTESPEAIYEGLFNINVEGEPHEIDIEFVEGPEAGNSNFGIFRLG